MRSLVLLVSSLFFTAVVAFEEDVDPETALFNPDLFEGDMMGIDSIEDLNAIAVDYRRWSNGVVYYMIDSSLSDKRNLIKQAMKQYEDNTCLKFKEITPPATGKYINFFKGVGCYSYVGMVSAKQPLSLGNGCLVIGTVVHEIGHALGFHHEQSRSDRDDYINVYWENISKGKEGNFRKLKPIENRLYNKFDYESVMIYGETAFSKDGKSKTMEDKNKIHKLTNPYSKKGMSKYDIERVNKLYQCK